MRFRFVFWLVLSIVCWANLSPGLPLYVEQGEEGDKKKGKLLFPDWGPFKKEKKAKKAPKKKKASIGKTVKGLIGESLRVPPHTVECSLKSL